MSKAILLCTLLTLIACTDPVVSVPGGALTGEVMPAPIIWIQVPATVQLEMRPLDPYSVNIWAVVAGNRLYVATQNAKWIPFITNDPQVRLRSDDIIYELNATRVTQKAELASVAAAYSHKYGLDPKGDWVSAGTVFALANRNLPGAD